MIGKWRELPFEEKNIENQTKSDDNNSYTDKVTFFKINVENLRVRETPNLESEVIEKLPINSEVKYLGETSDSKTIVVIKGDEINEYWYKIKTPNANIGWVHGCCFDSL